MAPLDWIVTAIPLVIVLAVGLYSRLFVRSVADFMSANRSAGRYLLCIAGGELQAGAVVFVAAFEAFGRGGFSVGWWYMFLTPISLVIGFTGFVGYRMRQTRALTLAQFFEIRYNKAFRVFAGILGFFAGILNFGVIPAVGARVMVYFLGLPERLHFFSHPVPPGTSLVEAPLTWHNLSLAVSFSLPTFVVLMALFLCVTLFVALSGGLITVMMIDTMEGIISQIFYLILIVTVLMLFTWPEMSQALTSRPPGHSLINPFDSFKTQDFNIWYVLMGMWLGVYGRGAWQNAAGYSGAALTPHEGRMGGILGQWREMGKNAVIVFLAIAAFTYMNHPDFAAKAAKVHERIGQISGESTQHQMEAIVALAFLLPVGVKGLLSAIFLMGIFGGDATHLHSWGSIFVQDVLVPLRKKPFGAKTHLWVLRGSICFVACWAFIFGACFTLVDFINMWWGLTMAIYVSGAGAAIIGGLYWKKGTTQGAFAGFITGSVLACSGIIMQQVYYYELTDHHKFWMNGTQIGFFSTLVAATVYVVVSLRTCREDFNLDRMLHRGEYAAMTKLVGDTPIVAKSRPGLVRFIGIDDNYSRGDKWIAGGLFAWIMLWLGVFVVVTTWNLIAPWPTTWWSVYRHYTGIYQPVFFAAVTCVWFTWGGLRDMRRLFVRLGKERVNHLDDGTVVNNQNLDEVAAEAQQHKR